MFLKKIYRLAMQIIINLNVKWAGGNVTTTPPTITDPPGSTSPIIPPTTSVIDITNLWYSTFSKGSGELILESGKTYSLNTVKTLNINGRLRIKTTGTEPAYLWVGKAFYMLYVDSGEDSILFHLLDGAEVVIDNINPSMREQNRNVQQMYSINWFSSVQDPNAKWTAVLKNCDTTFLGKNGGFGAGVLYGGTRENHIAMINYKHSGPMLGEFKNPYKDSVLYWTAKNVTTDYSNPFEWSKRAHKTTGILNSSNNILSLTGDVDTRCLYNHFFLVDVGANRSFLAHIGRFTFMVDTIGSVIDLKKIQLRPAPKKGERVFIKRNGDGVPRLFFNGREPHAGDVVKISGVEYTIARKDKTEWDEWTNEWQKGIHPQTYKATQCYLNTTTTLPDGEHIIEEYRSSFSLYDLDQPLYLVYKDDLGFPTSVDTKFGNYHVLEARGGNHMVYNHRQITIWAENVDLNSGIPPGDTDPYYRESTNGEGISLGYNIVNCTGFDDEFSNKTITTNKPIPQTVLNLI